MVRNSAAAERDAVETGEASLSGLLARASHLLRESFSEEVKARGISLTEWRVLAALCEHDGAAMTDLAGLVLFKQPTLTKAVDRMEQAQLVERRTPSEDRRLTQVYLTERGRRVASPLVQRARQHDAAVLRALGDTASRELRSGLLVLIESLREALPMRRGAPPRERVLD